jgi:hypothetical protein
VLFLYVIIVKAILLKQRIHIGNNIRFSQVFVGNSRSNKSILYLVPGLENCLDSIAAKLKVRLREYFFLEGKSIGLAVFGTGIAEIILDLYLLAFFCHLFKFTKSLCHSV